MRNLLISAVLGMMVVGAMGCKDHSMPSDKKADMKMDAMKDDCPFCPGVQHAKAEGTCPNCGMKVKG